MLNANSYTSFLGAPLKLALNKTVLENARRGLVKPVTVQINPTNKCSQHCSFCICEHRGRNSELSLATLTRFLEDFKELGGASVFYAGGGEPLEYFFFEKALAHTFELGLKAGVITNGWNWDKISDASLLGKCSWIRVSAHDELKNVSEWQQSLLAIKAKCPTVDWSISYILTRKPNVKTFAETVRFANANGFSHVRVAADTLKPDAVPMQHVMEQARFIDCSKVIWDTRASHTAGSNPCLMSIAKPVLDANGIVYPCCAATVARGPVRRYPLIMNYCTAESFREAVEKQQFFDGSECQVCYHKPYNDVLAALVAGVRHIDFI